GYLHGLIEERRAAPAEDLISHIIAQNEAGLSQQEIIGVCIEVMLAGWETSCAAISSFTYWLLTHHDENGVSHYRRLVAHPEEIPVAVEELLRMVPVGAEDGLPRAATRDVEIGGVTIKEGDLVVISSDASHRDPEVFPDPERVDLCRRPNRHMAFG